MELRLPAGERAAERGREHARDDDAREDRRDRHERARDATPRARLATMLDAKKKDRGLVRVRESGHRADLPNQRSAEHDGRLTARRGAVRAQNVVSAVVAQEDREHRRLVGFAHARVSCTSRASPSIPTVACAERERAVSNR